MEIRDAREKGFVRGASIEITGQHRIMTSNRIVKQGENLLAMGQSPFYLFFNNEWKAKVLPKIKNHGKST